MINIYQPSLGQEELDAIKKVFESNWLGKGKLTEEFVDNISSKLILRLTKLELIISSLTILPISITLLLYFFFIPSNSLLETNIFFAKGNKYLLALPMIRLFS